MKKATKDRLYTLLSVTSALAGVGACVFSLWFAHAAQEMQRNAIGRQQETIERQQELIEQQREALDQLRGRHPECSGPSSGPAKRGSGLEALP